MLESSRDEKSWILMILMDTLNCIMSCFECIISEALRRAEGSSGSNIMQPTSVGIRSRCKAHAAPMYYDMSVAADELGA
jgi:hypothetical protein